MTIKSTWFFGLVFSIALFCYSCTSTTEETIKITVKTQADGPFFEGPNSLMGNVALSNYTIATGTEINPENIVKAKLKSINIALNETDSVNFGSFTSASFQIVAGDLPMTSAIAILNPITSTALSVDLIASDEAELSHYLQNKEFTCVLDLALNEEYLEKESLQADITLEFTVELKK